MYSSPTTLFFGLKFTLKPLLLLLFSGKIDLRDPIIQIIFSIFFPQFFISYFSTCDLYFSLLLRILRTYVIKVIVVNFLILITFIVRVALSLFYSTIIKTHSLLTTFMFSFRQAVYLLSAHSIR